MPAKLATKPGAKASLPSIPISGNSSASAAAAALAVVSAALSSCANDSLAALADLLGSAFSALDLSFDNSSIETGKRVTLSFSLDGLAPNLLVNSLAVISCRLREVGRTTG